MSFASPWVLVALLAIPLVVAAAVQRSRQRDRFAMRFPAAASLAEAAAAEPVWQRRLPAALLLAAVASLMFAAARPQRTERVALQEASIMLVTDHSGSMQATDVSPTRLAAAQSAAFTFVNRLPKAVKLGIVAYSAAPDAVQPPTTDHNATRQVIGAQAADGGTATGDALATAIGLMRPQRTTRTPAAVVLLSDGATTLGADPEQIAREAKQLAVPIYTVALGTEDATVPNPDPFGPPLPAVPDPATLKSIARLSGGRAFTAQDAGSLDSIYRTLGSQLGSKLETRDVTYVPVVMGVLLLLSAAGLTVVRRRPLV